MESVFISSLARGDMAAIREATRRAVESLGMRPVMFETAPANDEGSRRALLDRLARCDVLVLLLGAEYGEAGERGISPTEEEFNEARERGIPVLALVQGVDREPAQEAFVERVRGSWEEGRFAPTFSDASDVTLAAVSALNDWRSRGASSELQDAARERAALLARGLERANQSYGGSKLRVVLVPTVGRTLLDALALDEAGLVDDLGMAARTSELVANEMAISQSLDGDGIRLSAEGGGYEQLNFFIGLDGAVVSEGRVGGQSGFFAGSVVLAERAHEVIAGSARFARAVWERIDRRDEVRDLLFTVAVPEASHKVYALEEPGGSMHIPTGLPHVLIIPDEPMTVRRADLTRSETVERMQAELKRRFAIAGGLYPQANRR